MRDVWLARQGLPAAKRSVTACLARGWLYTGGGQLPYVALHARGGMSRAAIDRAIAKSEAVEVLTVRSCAMLVGASDVPLALAAGRAAFARGPGAAAKKLGVTERELARLGDAIDRALEDGPLDTVALRAAIDPSLVRALGAAGRTLGWSTTLPIAIDVLHLDGRVRRAPAALDEPRPRYARWELAPVALDLDALVARYLAWCAPASAQDVAWWTGMPVREARAILARVVPTAPPRARPPRDAIALLPFRDNYTHLRRDLAPLVDDRDAATPVLDWSKGSVPLGRAQSLHQHTIVAGGAVIGAWDYDADRRELVWATFSKPASKRAIERAAAHMAAFVSGELGDLRFYALDNVTNRTRRLAYLRAAKFRGAS
jgi:hypothetical protein